MVIKKLIFNIGIVACIVIIFDFIIGKSLKHLYFTETSGLHYRTTYSIDSTNADILIFGSSRANHHYVPEIFEDSLNMTFYNTGRDGNSILYTLALFKSIINRYTPKIVIIDLMMMELHYNDKSYDRLSCLQPYYYKHYEIQNIVNLRGPYEKYKMLSSIYPYNSSILTIILGNMEFNKIRKSDNKGYVPLFNSLKIIARTNLDEIETYYDTTCINALTFISNSCNKKNILLLFIHSPLYAKTKQSDASEIITKIATENGAFFLNYLNDTTFLKHPSYFQDQVHLNDNGAKIFSSILTHTIKSGKYKTQNRF